MSDYKDKYYGPESRERDCGELHQTIEEAIVHAEQHLGCYRQPMTPYRGTTRENEGVIVGFAISARRRWRLDFSDQPGPEGEAKWVHVNEEDFDAPPGSQRIVHRVESRNFTLVALQYQKWRARYGRER
jgi:hypothetical protein